MRFNRYQTGFVACCALIALCAADPVFSKSKNRKRRYPPVTHPVVLWSRTLSESTDREQRKIAAFKLSQYTQPLYQEEVIATLKKCIRDSDTHIKVLCAKAFGRAGNQSKAQEIRKTLMEVYKDDPSLQDTIIRTFIVRKESNKDVHDLLLQSIKKAEDKESLEVLLPYFEQFALPSATDTFVDLYNKHEDIKIRRGIVKVLSERGQGQDAVVSILAHCTESKDTPLVLTCLSGLRSQARTDGKAWGAIEKALGSSDPDVILASLDVIMVMPETHQSIISSRLVDLIKDSDDFEIKEKAVLGIGVAGDLSEPLVDTLLNLLATTSEEGLKISTSLVLGKQGVNFREKVSAALEQCSKAGTSQAIKTACQLGMKELKEPKKN